MSAQRITRRYLTYLAVSVVLLAARYSLRDFDWQGSMTFHTLMEAIATLLAFFVGTLALIRYFNQRDGQFLYIGAGFIGTGLLDAYHAVVTSVFFLPYMPSGYPQLVPWSWFASRNFLAIMLFGSGVLWRRQSVNLIYKPAKLLWLTGLATLGCFLFFALVPLPPTSDAGQFVSRPFDLIPAIFFALALGGYLRKGGWRQDDFEHWLVLALLVSVWTQTAFMPFSAHLHDTAFNSAHVLKKISYVLVMIGLLHSLFQTYQALRRETDRRIAVENQLRIEAETSAKNERWFKTIADYAYDWETWFSPQGNLLYSSPASERITGYPAKDFQSGKLNMQAILSPKERVAVARHFQSIDEHGPDELEFKIITKQGTERWINHICHPVYDEHGQFLGRRGSNRDITARKLAELANKALQAAIDNAPVAVLITDPQANIEYVNPKFVEMTGYPPSEVLGKTPRLLKSGEHLPAFYQHMWSTLLQGDTWSGELKNRRRDGSLFWSFEAISPILDEEGNVWKFVAVKQDITEKKKQAEMLFQQANFDTLTGLPNRSYFDDRLLLAFKKACRRNEGLALLMLDLDYFKAVNDSLGHAAGDALLIQAAGRMHQCIRETDLVGRVGGDEFMVLIEQFTQPDIAQDIAQRLVDELARPFSLAGQAMQVSASVGLAFFNEQIADCELLKRQADIALYQAKNQGRNAWVIFKDA